VLGAANAGLLAVALISGSPQAAALAAAANAVVAGHVLLGLASAGASGKAYRSLAYAPRFLVWKIPVYLAALRPGHRTWVKTRRHTHV
jgi:hypothetical protein